jgi:hypothetical protein
VVGLIYFSFFFCDYINKAEKQPRREKDGFILSRDRLGNIHRDFHRDFSDCLVTGGQDELIL